MRQAAPVRRLIGRLLALVVGLALAALAAWIAVGTMLEAASLDMQQIASLDIKEVVSLVIRGITSPDRPANASLEMPGIELLELMLLLLVVFVAGIALIMYALGSDKLLNALQGIELTSISQKPTPRASVSPTPLAELDTQGKPTKARQSKILKHPILGPVIRIGAILVVSAILLAAALMAFARPDAPLSRLFVIAIGLLFILALVVGRIHSLLNLGELLDRTPRRSSDKTKQR